MHDAFRESRPHHTHQTGATPAITTHARHLPPPSLSPPA